MIKICFVCHGNICRSPMAEYVLKHKLKQNNLDNKIEVVSRATSYEEQGNDMHYGTKDMLDNHLYILNNQPTPYDSYSYGQRYNVDLPKAFEEIGNILAMKKEEKENSNKLIIK